MLLLEVNLLSILGLFSWIGLTFKKEYSIMGYQWGLFLFGNYMALTILLELMDLFDYPKFHYIKIIQLVLTIGIGTYLSNFFYRNDGMNWQI
jgi:hypothetical protein|tara:strand:- start:106 stop:381 length:276 start_codon:yes stop_codon:yes gene_type:complete